ncbi:MAG: LLM class flavin-dependent oxidoreductase [Microlunatus sp.]|nr:LLM class flavin-dependent oxidoreductase [Microlunatus sp.]
MAATTSIRLGVHIPPTIPPERLCALARAAERAGLDDLWVWEDSFKQSGVASATAALAWTSTVRVGITLLPVPLRNAALTAMELATIARMFPGRFVAGIGHGVQEWMGQAGVRAGSPLTLLREQATAIRRLLQGETVTTDGRYVRLDHVRLDWPPPVLPPLMIGGSGPKSIALAAELGDGNLLTNALTDDETATICDQVRAAKAKAGRPDADRPEIIACQIVATGPDGQRRLDAELPIWGVAPGRGIGVAGDADAIAASIRRYASYGITAYGVQPTADEADLEGLIDFVGRDVRSWVEKGDRAA